VSETPQAILATWLEAGRPTHLPRIREAIRAVLELVDVQYRVNEELGRDLEQTEGVARGYMLAAEKAEAERDALRSTVHDLSVQLEESGKEERALREIMRRLVAGIDKWNASVTPIIGRPVNYTWPALEEARAALFPEEKP
jgi:hypothetical protein